VELAAAVAEGLTIFLHTLLEDLAEQVGQLQFLGDPLEQQGALAQMEVLEEQEHQALYMRSRYPAEGEEEALGKLEEPEEMQEDMDVVEEGQEAPIIIR
jgi:hypothetical protein